MEEWLDNFPMVQVSILNEAESKARKLQQDYLAQLQHIRVIRHGLNDALSIQSSHTRNDSNIDWERLRANPLIKSFGLQSGGLHIITESIVYSYDGKCYRLGSYIIRISGIGAVSVWAKESAHPRGIPHPHIGWSGDPCFGNISKALYRASTGGRTVDAVEFVLRWLTEGYDPLLAEESIHAWPEEIPS